MIYTLLLGHRPENHYDGYGAHRHVELIAVPPPFYLSYADARGIVFPQKDWADLLLNPWHLHWVRENISLVGYDFSENVGAEHVGLYALGDRGNIHDGIDASPTSVSSGLSLLGAPIRAIQSGYINANGRHATADVYAVSSDNILRETECWLWTGPGGWERGDLRNGTSYYQGLPYREIAAMAGRSVSWDGERRSASF